MALDRGVLVPGDSWKDNSVTEVYQTEQETNSGLEAVIKWHWIGVFWRQAIIGKTMQYDTGIPD